MVARMKVAPLPHIGITFSDQAGGTVLWPPIQVLWVLVLSSSHLAWDAGEDREISCAIFEGGDTMQSRDNWRWQTCGIKISYPWFWVRQDVNGWCQNATRETSDKVFPLTSRSFCWQLDVGWSCGAQVHARKSSFTQKQFPLWLHWEQCEHFGKSIILSAQVWDKKQHLTTWLEGTCFKGKTKHRPRSSYLNRIKRVVKWTEMDSQRIRPQEMSATSALVAERILISQQENSSTKSIASFRYIWAQDEWTCCKASMWKLHTNGNYRCHLRISLRLNRQELRGWKLP